jgi:hypothetical protein
MNENEVNDVATWATSRRTRLRQDHPVWGWQFSIWLALRSG